MWQRTCHINALTFSATVTSITSLAIVLNPLTFRTVFSSCAWDWRWFLVHGGIDLIKAGISFSTKHLLRDIHCSAYLCGTWYHFGNILWRLFLYSVLLGLFACIFSLFFSKLVAHISHWSSHLLIFHFCLVAYQLHSFCEWAVSSQSTTSTVVQVFCLPPFPASLFSIFDDHSFCTCDRTSSFILLVWLQRG